MTDICKCGYPGGAHVRPLQALDGTCYHYVPEACTPTVSALPAPVQPALPYDHRTRTQASA